LTQGNFNHSSLVEGHNGRKYIIRRENPDGRAKELPYVEAEYHGVGFFENAGRFSRSTKRTN